MRKQKRSRLIKEVEKGKIESHCDRWHGKKTRQQVGIKEMIHKCRAAS